MTEILLLTTVGLVVLVGNRLNWRILPGLTNKDGERHRIPTYVYGVGCILAGLFVWGLADGGDYTWAWRALALSVAAGVGAILPRIWDWVTEQFDRSEDRKDHGHGQAVQGD